MAWAKEILGFYEEGLVWRRRCIEANRNFWLGHFGVAADLVQLGQLDEARAAAKAGFALNPSFTLSRGSAIWSASSDDPKNLAHLARLLDALRKVGVPE